MHSLQLPMVQRSQHALAIALLLFFISPSAVPQIKIQERVSINPQSADSPALVSSSIRVELSWDAPLANARMSLLAPCLASSDTTLYPTGGTTISYTIADARAGLYRVNPQISISPPTTVTMTTRIFLDDSLVAQGTGTDVATTCGGFCPFPGASQFIYAPPAFTRFALTTPFTGIYHSQSLSLDLTGGYDCTANEWIPETDPVTLQITTGSELGEFCRLSGDCLGPAVTILASELSDIQFVANGVEPPAEGSTVTVQASSNGIVSQTTFMVYRRGPLHLSMYSPFGTQMFYGDDLSLFVDCLNDRGDPFPPGANVTYTFEVIAGQQWGWLSDYTMNELGDFAPDIAQQNGRAVVLFSALEDAPDSTKSIVVRVSASDTTIAPAEITLTLRPQIVPYVVVTIDPPQIGVGDTASINVQRMNESRVLENYPQDQLFDIAIRSGTQYGVLLSGGQTADQFTEVSEGFKFIADDSIDTDLARAIITVRLPGIPTRPVGSGETGKKLVKKGEGAMAPFYFDGGGVGTVSIAGDTTGCPIVMFNPPEIAAGETTAVFIKKQKADGTVEEYPPEQLFSAEVLGETPYGRLFSSLQPDTVVSLTGHRDDIWFVAASEIPGDSIVVSIHVELVQARPNKPYGNRKKLLNKQGLEISPQGTKGTGNPASTLTAACQLEWDVVVKKKCSFSRREDAVFSVSNDLILSPELFDIQTSRDDVSGITRFDQPTYTLSDQRTHYQNKGLFAISDLQFTIEWGLVYSNCLPQECIRVDQNLSNVTAENKQDVLNNIKTIWRERSGGFGRYWLLEASKAHEKVHVDELRRQIPIEYNEALREINRLRLPEDYCRLPVETVRALLDAKRTEAEKFMRDARIRLQAYQSEIESNVDDKHAPAYDAGYQKAREIYDRIVNEI